MFYPWVDSTIYGLRILYVRSGFQRIFLVTVEKGDRVPVALQNRCSVVSSADQFFPAVVAKNDQTSRSQAIQMLLE